jgi:peptidoglycan hydrolase-like protein with peptidoglycan-binding domain
MIQNEFARILKEKIKEEKTTISENYFRVKKKLILTETTSKLKQLLTEAEKRSWSKGVFNNGDGVKTPKITINKGNNFFDISYKGPESGFNIESAALNPGDSIHQLSNVFTYEVNKHLKDLYQKEIYVKPNMEGIEMVKTPNFFEIKVNFDETDKENAITKIERRGGMGHSATKGKSLMEEKCNKYSGCKKVYTIKSGSITEHFISYIDKPKQEGEETENDVDLITDLEKIYNQKETFEKQKKPYPVEKDVKLLQTALQFLGFSLPQWGVDGRFGPETEKAVTDFQEKYSLDVTGIVDQETMGKIVEKMDESDFENEDMNKIQKNKVEDIKTDTKTKVEDIKNDTKNIIIGDSITPHLAKAAGTGFISGPKALSINDYSGVGLWYGGIGLTGLQKMADAYKTVHPKVKNVVITIGTNGYGGTGGVSTLAKNLKRIFPNAKLFVCQGAYGPGWKSTPYPSLAKHTDKYVNTFYEAFADAGITVVPYPIKDTVTEVHTPNVPVYKKWVSFINNNAN